MSVRHGSMGAYLDRIKNHFTFSLTELQNLAILCLVMAFLFGFDDGNPTFVLSKWLSNYFAILILVIIIVFLHESAHKLWALGSSYRSEYKLWPYGIAIALMLAFVTKGKFYFLALGGVWVTDMAVHRIGGFRYGLSTFLSTWIAFAGPMANILLALIFKPIYIATGSEFIGMFVKINLFYAIFSMIPIPPLDGSTGFYGGRSTFMLLLGFIIGAAIMIWVANSYWLMLVGTIIFGIVFWFIYYYIVEKES
jgi:Zn-dependent protease